MRVTTTGQMSEGGGKMSVVVETGIPRSRKRSKRNFRRRRKGLGSDELVGADDIFERRGVFAEADAGQRVLERRAWERVDLAPSSRGTFDRAG